MTIEQLPLDLLLTPAPPALLTPRAPVLHRARAEAKRDAAIQRADEHADEAWKETALAIVKQVAESRARFTTDAVIALLAETNVRTHEPRALGAVMRRAARMGWIVATNEFERCEAVSRHRTFKLVWRSLLFNP